MENQNSITAYHPGQEIPADCRLRVSEDKGFYSLQITREGCPISSIIDAGSAQYVLAEAARRYPVASLSMDTSCLSAPPVRVLYRKDVKTVTGLAVGVMRKPLLFVGADRLYHHLRENGYEYDGEVMVLEDKEVLNLVYPLRYDSPDDIAAWEIAAYRLEHKGEISPEMEVPLGVCPQCLSRNLLLFNGNAEYQCQECFYGYTHPAL